MDDASDGVDTRRVDGVCMRIAVICIDMHNREAPMKIVIAEPLGIADQELDRDIRELLPGGIDLARYADRPADDETYA